MFIKKRLIFFLLLFMVSCAKPNTISLQGTVAVGTGETAWTASNNYTKVTVKESYCVGLGKYVLLNLVQDSEAGFLDWDIMADIDNRNSILKEECDRLKNVLIEGNFEDGECNE